jgi:hypothetical protein
MTALNTDVLRGGLEINLNLLRGVECCIRPARAAVAGVDLTSKQATDGYTISDCFLSIIHYKSDQMQLGMMKSMLPFMSVFQTVAPVQNASSISH